MELSADLDPVALTLSYHMTSQEDQVILNSYITLFNGLAFSVTEN